MIYLLIFLSILWSDGRYESAMEKGINMIDGAESREDFIKSSNFFYRIYQAEKNNWLPSYYYSIANVRISMTEKESFIKDEYLDKALNIISDFDSLSISDLDSLAKSEIYTLKAMIYSAKIMIDPMSRGRKLGAISEQMINNSISYFPSNPRPYLISGQMKFYTPAAFGGGIDKAMPILEKSIMYYDSFKNQKFWPFWGQEDAQKMYQQGLDMSNKK